jgi:hypothetical protein
MSPVTNLWRQLVQRRLWPVAIVLIAALAAVPLTLAKEPAPAPAPAPAPPVAEDELAVAPIVTAVSAEDRTERRRVLGAAKNPFAVAKPAKRVVGTDRAEDVAPAPKPERDDADEPAATGAPATPPASGGSAPTTTVDPDAETPAPSEKTYGKDDIAVRFGDASAGSDRKTLKRLQALPSAREPVLIYLGLLKDGKTAEFLLDHGVEAIGDGECRPNVDACERIRLRAGETEFVDVTDEEGTVVAQYQLDFLKVHRSARASAAKAKASVVGARAALAASPGPGAAQLP